LCAGRSCISTGPHRRRPLLGVFAIQHSGTSDLHSAHPRLPPGRLFIPPRVDIVVILAVDPGTDNAYAGGCSLCQRGRGSSIYPSAVDGERWRAGGECGAAAPWTTFPSAIHHSSSFSDPSPPGTRASTPLPYMPTQHNSSSLFAVDPETGDGYAGDYPYVCVLWTGSGGRAPGLHDPLICLPAYLLALARPPAVHAHSAQPRDKRSMSGQGFSAHRLSRRSTHPSSWATSSSCSPSCRRPLRLSSP
jgi:hypothetical protein